MITSVIFDNLGANYYYFLTLQYADELGISEEAYRINWENGAYALSQAHNQLREFIPFHDELRTPWIVLGELLNWYSTDMDSFIENLNTLEYIVRDNGTELGVSYIDWHKDNMESILRDE